MTPGGVVWTRVVPLGDKQEKHSDPAVRRTSFFLGSSVFCAAAGSFI